jgi:hypothetical protein
VQITNIGNLLGSTSTKTKPNAGSTSLSEIPASGTTDSSSKDDGFPQEFLKLAKMNPFDRMRANVLKGMGLSEADLAKLPPAQQAAIQQKITDAIRQQMQKDGAQSGSVLNFTA